MSKVRNLPQTTSLDDADLLYAVDVSAGPNGGRKINKADLKTSVAQSPSEIKTAYESNSDTNAFTDAEKSKLAGIETGATADQNASEVPYNNSVSGLSATEVQSAIDELSSAADFRPSIVSGRIIHYTGGTARFDDIFFDISGNDILLNPNITNGTVYVDLDGIVKQTASNVTPPPYTIVIALFSTDLNDIIGLIDQRVKNSQNIVRGLVTDIRDVRAGAAASAGSSGRISDAMHKHNILTGTPSTQTPDQSNAEGTSVDLARADHVHNIPTDAPTTNLNPSSTNSEGSGTSFSRNDHTHALDMAQAGDLSTINAGDVEALGSVDRLAKADHQHPVATGTPSTQTPDQANAEGVSTSFARADHIHNIPAASPTTNLNPATTNSEGVGTSFARNDHTHAIDTGLVGDVTTIQPDASASAGVIDKYARADHRHAIVADAPTTTLSPTTTNAEGVGTSFSRNDHTHAVATALVGDITTIQPDDVANAGTANTFARGDHKHAIVAATPSTQTPDQANAEGVSTSFSRADHVHNIPAGTPSTTLSPTTTNAKGAAPSFALSDHTHAVATALVADITTIQPDDAASAGTANTFARGDHKHAIAAAAPSTQTPDQANAEGVSTSFARADHIHNIAADAPTTTLSPATTNSEGVGTSFARNDHTHAVATALAADITTIQPDASASAGTTNTFARGDHRHAIVTDPPVNTGSANAEGVSTSFSRADHVHNTTIANSSATATADDTTTSTTDTQIASMTLTPAAGTYLVTFSTSVLNSANGVSRLFVSIYSAGARVAHSERNIGIAGGANVPVHCNAIVTVNGSQAIQAMWRAVAGTNTAHQRSLTALRIGD